VKELARWGKLFVSKERAMEAIVLRIWSWTEVNAAIGMIEAVGVVEVGDLVLLLELDDMSCELAEGPGEDIVRGCCL
jgi:hypothetical protein